MIGVRVDGRGRARRYLPEEAVEKQNTPSSCMCVTAFPEMSRQPIKCDKLKTGSTVIRQKQTHAEPSEWNGETVIFSGRKELASTTPPPRSQIWADICCTSYSLNENLWV